MALFFALLLAPLVAAAELLDSREAAEYLSTTPRHVRRLVSDHGLPLVRIGGRKVRFRREDLDKWIAARREVHRTSILTTGRT